MSGRITPRIETEGVPAPEPETILASPPAARQSWIEPRIEAETMPALRLEALPEAAQPPARARWGMPALVASGAATLVLGLSGLEAGNFIADEFARSAPLGYGALTITGAGFGLIGTGFVREARALGALRSVDRLRADLLGNNAQRRVRAARAWVRTLPEGEALLPAIDAINDPDAVLALLRAGPAVTLRARADALGRAAAMQAVVGIAAMPSAGLAALYIAWRGLRLVRQVAALHGLRPGLFGTLSLLRRTALSAGAVAGAELAANAAAHAVLSNALLQHVAGEMAGCWGGCAAHGGAGACGGCGVLAVGGVRCQTNKSATFDVYAVALHLVILAVETWAHTPAMGLRLVRPPLHYKNPGLQKVPFNYWRASAGTQNSVPIAIIERNLLLIRSLRANSPSAGDREVV